MLWKRFIDDIFVIWTGSASEFTTYMNIINQLHHTIKFTYELSETEFTFLDITLYKGHRFDRNQILDIRTHIKPTKKQLYIHADESTQVYNTQPNASEPEHTTQSLPIGYPHTIFNNTLQNFRNPIKRCCHACAIYPLLITRCFAESTTLKQKVPINLPHPKQFL